MTCDSRRDLTFTHSSVHARHRPQHLPSASSPDLATETLPSPGRSAACLGGGCLGV